MADSMRVAACPATPDLVPAEIKPITVETASAPGAPSAAPADNRLRSLLILVAIVGIGIALRCAEITTRSLWFDEAWSYWITRLPLAEMLDRIIWDNHPPLYFLLLRVWTAMFGTSLVALRSLGVLFGGCTIVGAYLFTVEARRGLAPADGAAAPALAQARGTALWVAALIALSVFQIRSSWDVRMYALGAALAAFSSWALLCALHSPQRHFGFWLLYAFFAILFLYTHYFAIFTIATQVLFVTGYLLAKALANSAAIWRQPALPGAVLALALMCLGWLALMPHFLDRHSHVGTSFWVPKVSWISTGVNCYHMLIEPECYVRVPAICMAPCAIVCLGLPLALLRKPRPVYWYVAGAALIPIGLAALASMTIGTQVFYSRYFLFAHIFILTSLGLLLGRIRQRWARRTAGGLLLLCMLGVDLSLILKLGPENNPSCRGVVTYVEEHRRPDEPVVVCSQLSFLPLRYHAGSAPGWYQFGISSDPGSMDSLTATGGGNVMGSERMRELSGGRVWAVDTTSAYGPPSEVPVPHQWIARSRRAFRDTYGMESELVVVEYEVVRTDVDK